MTEQLSTYPLPTGGATPTALTDGYVPVFGFLEAAAA
jgi:hypothetical protein